VIPERPVAAELALTGASVGQRVGSVRAVALRARDGYCGRREEAMVRECNGAHDRCGRGPE